MIHRNVDTLVPLCASTTLSVTLALTMAGACESMQLGLQVQALTLEYCAQIQDQDDNTSRANYVEVPKRGH